MSMSCHKYFRSDSQAIVVQALTHYHDLKIKEINDLIKGLWTNTYKGMDIESIEIR